MAELATCTDVECSGPIGFFSPSVPQIEKRQGQESSSLASRSGLSESYFSALDPGAYIHNMGIRLIFGLGCLRTRRSWL